MSAGVPKDDMSLKQSLSKSSRIRTNKKENLTETTHHVYQRRLNKIFNKQNIDRRTFNEIYNNAIVRLRVATKEAVGLITCRCRYLRSKQKGIQ